MERVSRQQAIFTQTKTAQAAARPTRNATLPVDRYTAGAAKPPPSVLRPNLPPLDPKSIKPAQWTFFVHLNADNSLEPQGVNDVNEMEAQGSIPGKVNVIALVDGGSPNFDKSQGWSPNTRLMLIQRDAKNSNKLVSRRIAVDPKSALGISLAKGNHELDMGSPAVLREAIQYVQAKIPSKHFLLDVWDHGDAWRGVSYDDHPHDNLSVADGLRDALSGLKIDVFGNDSCLMATQEVAEVAAENKTLGYLVASEDSEPGSGWNYTDVLGRMRALFAKNAQVSPAQMAHAIANSYAAGPKSNTTMSVTDLSKLGVEKAAFQLFAKSLVDAGGFNSPGVLAAYENARRFGSEQIDVGDFASRVAAAAPGATPLRAAAEALVANLKGMEFTTAAKGDNTKGLSGLTAYGPESQVDPAYTAVADAPWMAESWKDFIATYPRPSVVKPHVQPFDPNSKALSPEDA